MPNSQQERSHRNRVPVESTAKNQGGRGDPVRDGEGTFRSPKKNRLSERLMNRAHPPLTFRHPPASLEKGSAKRKERRHQLRRAERAGAAKSERRHLSHAGSMFADGPHYTGANDRSSGDRVRHGTLQVVL